jgi:hypothetical protein
LDGEVVLDLRNNIMTWGFDVLQRATASVTGRGTDMVQFAQNGSVVSALFLVAPVASCCLAHVRRAR